MSGEILKSREGDYGKGWDVVGGSGQELGRKTSSGEYLIPRLYVEGETVNALDQPHVVKLGNVSMSTGQIRAEGFDDNRMVD